MAVDDKTLREVLASPDSVNSEDYIIVKMRIQIDGTQDPHHVCAEMALNTAHGTMARLPWAHPTRTPLVLDVSELGDRYRVEVAYPLEMFGATFNLPQLLTLAWFPSEYSSTKHLWIDDIQLPPALVSSIAGPKRGQHETLALLGRKPGRPLLSAIVKPRYAGDLDQLGQAAKQALRGGVDGIVDDELLVDPVGDLAFGRRVERLTALTREAEIASGSVKYYFANVTAPINQSLHLIETAHGLGAKGIIANPFVLGYSAFEYLAGRCKELDLVVVDCSIGSAMVCLPTGSSGTAISLLCKLARMMGSDASHSGSEGEHWYTPATLRRVIASLTAPFGHLKPTLPIIAGQVNVGNVWRKLSFFGSECMVNAGTGIWAHPGGPEGGARAITRILDEVSLDLDYDDAHQRIMKIYSRDKAVRDGIEKWGYPL